MRKQMMTLGCLLIVSVASALTPRDLVMRSGARITNCKPYYTATEWAQLVSAGATNRVACGKLTGAPSLVTNRVSQLYGGQIISPFAKNSRPGATSALIADGPKFILFSVFYDKRVVIANEIKQP